MLTLHITKLGTPKTVSTKYGDKQKSYIKATEYGENFLNYWLSISNQNWREGSVVEVEAVEEGEYNGKKQYTIRMPKVDNRAPAPGGEAVKHFEDRLKKLETDLKVFKDAMRPVYLEFKKNEVHTTSEGGPIPFPTDDDYADEMMKAANAF